MMRKLPIFFAALIVSFGLAVSGWAQLTTLQSGSAPKIAAATAWSASDKTAGIGLSNSNLTATNGGSNAWNGVRSTASHATGKYYVQATTGAGVGVAVRFGIATASFVLTNPLGSDGNGIALDNNGGIVVLGVSISNDGTFNSSATTIGMAVDTDNTLIWFRVNGGQWNGDIAANQNPVGSVGGVNYGIWFTGQVFVTFSPFDASYPVTVNFNPGGVSGYGGW